MKKFLKLMLQSGFGTAGAVLALSLMGELIIYGQADEGFALVRALVVGTVFGAIFAAVHAHRVPSFKSSLITAAIFMAFGYGGTLALVTLYIPSFPGVNVLSAIGWVTTATVCIACGAWAGSQLSGTKVQ